MNNEMPRPPWEIVFGVVDLLRVEVITSAPSPRDTRHPLIALIFGTVSECKYPNRDFKRDMKSE